MKRRIGALLTSLFLAHLSMACMHNHSDDFKGESYATLKEHLTAKVIPIEIPVGGYVKASAAHRLAHGSRDV